MERFLRFTALLASLLIGGCGGNLRDAFTSSPLAPDAGSGSAAVASSTASGDLPTRDGLSDERRVNQLMELRKASREHPGDADLMARLRTQEEQTAAHFLASGNALLAKNQYAEAVQQFELGLVANPGSAQLQDARIAAMRRKESARLFAEEQRARSVGNFDLAQSLLEKADSLDRGNAALKTEIKDLEKQRSTEASRYLIKAFSVEAPIAVNFRQAKLKEALKAVSEPYNLNFVFDQDTEELNVSVSAQNVTFRQAFQMILQASNTSYKAIGPNSLMVYLNTPEKRAKYADLYFKTFHLYNIKAERMAEILKTSMDLKTMVANNELNTLQVRDSREALEVVEHVIAANDRTPAEIMLDVEILEINRSKAEQLGLDYGSQISMTFPQDGPNGGVAAKNFVNGQFLKAVLGEAQVTLPSLTLKYMQHDVDARVLAKPRIRTMDGKPAKIHIGDRVPLRSASVQDVTGQTRTMFEYRDIGIRLDVLPKYHLDDTISVELNMEVSALGANLGTAAEPAYAIGTRNVTTTMLLREGETALLGGLIRDEERRATSRVPGLGQLAIVGHLFSNNDDSDTRTDVLLTVTPKVIRDQALPRHKDSNFYSGSHGNFTTEASYDYLKKVPSESEPPRYKLKPDNNDSGVASVQAARRPAPAGVAPGWVQKTAADPR